MANKALIKLREDTLKLSKDRDALQKKTAQQLGEARKEADLLRKQLDEERAEAAAAVRKHAEALDAYSDRAADAEMAAAEERNKALRKIESELSEGFRETLRQMEMEVPDYDRTPATSCSASLL